MAHRDVDSGVRIEDVDPDQFGAILAALAQLLTT